MMQSSILSKFLGIVRNPSITVSLPNTRHHSKHYNPKWKKLRGKKFIKVDLSRFENAQTKQDEENMIRKKMQERGLLPQRPWIERPMYMSCTGSIFESYVPPEGDGKYSIITKAGAKQNVEFLTKKGKSFQAVKKIKGYEEDFDVKEFANQALELYKKAHETLADELHDDLTKYVTEKAYAEMLFNLNTTTIKWQYLKSIDPVKVVHARCTTLMSEANVYAQITARIHSQQCLAIYDRFGRLMNGSEFVHKDVLEYVVYEKHLSNTYGSWRLHGKILPEWLPAETPVTRTFEIIKNEAKAEAEAKALPN